MGGALQAIARSSPARGARMEGKGGREGGRRATGRSRGRGGKDQGGWDGQGLSYCITTAGHEKNTDTVFMIILYQTGCIHMLGLAGRLATHAG